MFPWKEPEVRRLSMLGGGLKGLKAKNGELHDFTFTLLPTAGAFRCQAVQRMKKCVS
jgi:hypothetical protein